MKKTVGFTIIILLHPVGANCKLLSLFLQLLNFIVKPFILTNLTLSDSLLCDITFVTHTESGLPRQKEQKGWIIIIFFRGGGVSCHYP